MNADSNMDDAAPSSPSRGGAKRPETCRMFENELLEKLSRIHPATPFVVWIPVALGVLYWSWMRHWLSAGIYVGLVLGGGLLWTFAEYVLHRWVFHWDNGTAFSKRVNFFMHGVHHEYPNDKDRLVMPLLMSAPLAVIFYSLFYFVFGAAAAPPIFVGFVAGYLCYDGTHYAVHHFRQRSRAGKYIRRHHMLHHYRDYEGAFGVSSPAWDVVFRTMPRIRPVANTVKKAAVEQASP
ncbi:MAG: sterol desaturase family protein [Polyangiaceae bacterium]|nr:sterol desaturase family protein [Polyangiaceae bacterium]